MVDEAISITRNLSIDLSQAMLQGEGLTKALVWLSTQMQEQYRLKVTLQKDGVSTAFEDTIRIWLFEAVREALFNIVRHAKTLRATIHLEQIHGHVRLRIRDDVKVLMQTEQPANRRPCWVY